MKKINFKFIGILLLVILALGSCKKWIDPNVNTSPDSPPDVDMSVLLAYSEVNKAYNTIGGNDIARVTRFLLPEFPAQDRDTDRPEHSEPHNHRQDFHGLPRRSMPVSAPV